MPTSDPSARKPSRTAPVEALASAQRRQVLATLVDRSTPIHERDLATSVAAAEQEKPLVEVTGKETRSVRVALRHSHLPALADAGLVSYDPDDGTVRATSHPALDDPWLQRIVATDADDWDAVVDALADDRRRTVLAALAERDGPVQRRALARAVAERESTDDRVDADDVLVSLHHVHLPKLAAAGLIEYDGDAAAYRGHPDLDPAWFDQGDARSEDCLARMPL